MIRLLLLVLLLEASSAESQHLDPKLDFRLVHHHSLGYTSQDTPRTFFDFVISVENVGFGREVSISLQSAPLVGATDSSEEDEGPGIIQSTGTQHCDSMGLTIVCPTIGHGQREFSFRWTVDGAAMHLTMRQRSPDALLVAVSSQESQSAVAFLSVTLSSGIGRRIMQGIASPSATSR